MRCCAWARSIPEKLSVPWLAFNANRPKRGMGFQPMFAKDTGWKPVPHRMA